jgi:hypothetical protein
MTMTPVPADNELWLHRIECVLAELKRVPLDAKDATGRLGHVERQERTDLSGSPSDE